MYAFCLNHGCRPCAGGYYDQYGDDTAYFEIFDGERGRKNKEHADEIQRKADAARRAR